ncbi:immunoglobulin-like domain-containing protein [Bacillus sp. SJS]|uniref:immunoglobulin-like domain-containing protein n=1 Tax=Bacillus sp. SJS TaxID=1423321 RepID=UPI0004DCC649|nr:immunoglobulin-like domain-containing protein [Bacillus sp. SJS]KZZ84584.1 hypothetical protein AS29_010455 [Bacillus sp. SJS]
MKLKKVMAFFMFALLALSGCSTKEAQGSASAEDQLPSQIGAPGKEHEYFVWPGNIHKKTEYGPHTGKYFKRRGGFHFDTSGYYMSAKSPVHAVLKVSSAEKTIRYQLTERDRNYKKLKLIAEKTAKMENFSAVLPDKENALYVLSIEILGDKGQVEDTAVELIYVPTAEINAKVSFNKKQITKSDSLQLTLENYGPQELLTGVSYHYEKWTGWKWKLVNLDMAFNSVGVNILPGESQTLTLNTSELPAGKYRVVKDVQNELNMKADLAAEFEIK